MHRPSSIVYCLVNKVICALLLSRRFGYTQPGTRPAQEAAMERPAGWGPQYASAFQEPSVADAYAFRPPYPPAVFDLLRRLLPSAPQRLLDVGCGTGALARQLTGLALPIDAIDISPAMIARGKRLPNGSNPLIHWMVGAVETAPVTPPYDLITAGESLHWMEWATVLPRFAALLAPQGRLVILDLDHQRMPWSTPLGRLIQRYSTNQEYQAVDLVSELEQRQLLRVEGRMTTDPWVFRQSVDAYVESFHGRASFARERMDANDAQAFDRQLRDLVTPHVQALVELPLIAQIVWGRPLAQIASTQA
jgi:ubiquinone/menaquinone biosynthesis C-methylase UbiE